MCFVFFALVWVVQNNVPCRIREYNTPDLLVRKMQIWIIVCCMWYMWSILGQKKTRSCDHYPPVYRSTIFACSWSRDGTYGRRYDAAQCEVFNKRAEYNRLQLSLHRRTRADNGNARRSYRVDVHFMAVALLLRHLLKLFCDFYAIFMRAVYRSSGGRRKLRSLENVRFTYFGYKCRPSRQWC